MPRRTSPFPMFDHWAQQSPIKLFKAQTIYVPFPKNFLTIHYEGAPFAGTFDPKEDHENFVLSPLPAGQRPPTISMGGVQAELKTIHLHTPSEHDLEGKNQAGEIHLLHKITNSTGESSLIVLGVFFDKKFQSSCHDFFDMWAANVNSKTRRAAASTPTCSIDPRRLLPKTTKKTTKWFRYEGSLTSEPYTETVSWIVFVDALGIDSPDLRKLKKKAAQPERKPLKVDRRFILRNFK